MLLAAGANPHFRDNSQQTAMYYANSIEVIRVLLEAGVPLDDEDDLGWSPLMHAVSDGIDAIGRIRAMIAGGADVNATHDRGFTVFMFAAGSMERHIDVLRLLIESGANPHAVSELGYNAFHAAVDVNGEANEEQSVRSTLGYLKDLGVDIEQRNARGQTPLARALTVGYGLEAQVLCELGANPNAVCTRYVCGGKECDQVECPLIFQAATGSVLDRGIKVTALLRVGADPLVTDAEGFTPLEHAVAELCSSTDDCDGAYRLFFEGVKEVRLAEGQSLPETRDEFVKAAMPPLKEFVERFASGIPSSSNSEFDTRWRQQDLECIIALCAYGSWAVHQKLCKYSQDSSKE